MSVSAIGHVGLCNRTCQSLQWDMSVSAMGHVGFCTWDMSVSILGHVGLCNGTCRSLQWGMSVSDGYPMKHAEVSNICEHVSV